VNFGEEKGSRDTSVERPTNWPVVMKALDNDGYNGLTISEQTGN